VRSFNARFRKSLDQVIDHRANASGNEAATWHYRADRYGFAFMLRKQSNQPASAKVGRDVHAGFVAQFSRRGESLLRVASGVTRAFARFFFR